MDNKEMNELFFGKDITERAERFKKEIEILNEKHKDFFKERKSHLPSQEHDNIHNHIMTYTANGTVTFNFTDNELPEHIKDDCIEAFKKVYEGAKPKQ